MSWLPRFAQIEWFALAPLVLIPIWVARRAPRLSWPDVNRFRKMPVGLPRVLRGLPVTLQCAGIAAVLIALARPQTVAATSRIHARSTAIVLALDASRTMSTEPHAGKDGPTTQFDAARESFARFVSRRPGDLIGLVAFADYPDTACPPTLDHAFLIESLARLPAAPPQEPGTNLGDALAWAIRDVHAASPRRKVIILATDGRNEPGHPPALDPLGAARLARDLGIAVHIIALGGTTDALNAIATAAGGTLHPATEPRALESILKSIDRLERSPVTSTIRSRYREWYPAWLWLAVGCVSAAPLFWVIRRQLP